MSSRQNDRRSWLEREPPAHAGPGDGRQRLAGLEHGSGHHTFRTPGPWNVEVPRGEPEDATASLTRSRALMGPSTIQTALSQLQRSNLSSLGQPADINEVPFGEWARRRATGTADPRSDQLRRPSMSSSGLLLPAPRFLSKDQETYRGTPQRSPMFPPASASSNGARGAGSNQVAATGILTENGQLKAELQRLSDSLEREKKSSKHYQDKCTELTSEAADLKMEVDILKRHIGKHSPEASKTHSATENAGALVRYQPQQSEQQPLRPVSGSQTSERSPSRQNQVALRPSRGLSTPDKAKRLETDILASPGASALNAFVLSCIQQGALDNYLKADPVDFAAEFNRLFRRIKRWAESYCMRRGQPQERVLSKIEQEFFEKNSGDLPVLKALQIPEARKAIATRIISSLLTRDVLNTKVAKGFDPRYDPHVPKLKNDIIINPISGANLSKHERVKIITWIIRRTTDRRDYGHILDQKIRVSHGGLWQRVCHLVCKESNPKAAEASLYPIVKDAHNLGIQLARMPSEWKYVFRETQEHKFDPSVMVNVDPEVSGEDTELIVRQKWYPRLALTPFIIRRDSGSNAILVSTVIKSEVIFLHKCRA